MKRPMLLATVWLVGAATAVGLGVLGVSLVGTTSPSTQQDGFLTVISRGPARASASADATSGQQETPGGIAYASCSGGVPVVAGAPAEGWQVDDSGNRGHVEFSDAVSTVEVTADCSSGSPEFSVEGPRARDGGRHGSDHGEHDSGRHDDDD